MEGKRQSPVSIRPFVLVFLSILIIILTLFFFSLGNISKKNLSNISPTPASSKNKDPGVSLKTEYKNPFDKETQYINPFSEYKNPFDK